MTIRVIDKDYKKMLEFLYEGIYFVDTERTITSWNKGAEKITGFTADEVVGRKCYENILNHVDDQGNQLCLIGCPLHGTIGDGVIREARVFLQHKKGYRVPVAIKTLPMYDDNGEIIGAAEIFVDDKNKVQILNSLEQYKKEATEDALTGISSRRYIKAVLEAKKIEYDELGTSFGVAFMDIDNFKGVNDIYGHDAGDEVLKMVAKTFEANLRRQDVVGRWGGEEFVAVFSSVDTAGIQSVTEKMRVLVEQSRIRNGSEEIHVTVSIGVTLALPEDNPESIIKRADDLMYKSKQSGKNRVTIG